MSDKYLNHPSRIVRTTELDGVFGSCGRTRTLPSFPKAIRFAKGYTGWKLSEVQAFFSRVRGLTFPSLTPASEGQMVSLPDLVVLLGLSLWETKVFVARPDFPKKKVTPEGFDRWDMDEVLAFIDKIQRG